MAAVGVVCLLSEVALAEPCPPRLVGPDLDLLAAVQRHLDEAPVRTSTTTDPACVPMVVEVRAGAEGLSLAVVEGGRRQRARGIQSPATAADLVTAWSASAVSDLALGSLDLVVLPAVPETATAAATGTVALARVRAATSTAAPGEPRTLAPPDAPTGPAPGTPLAAKASPPEGAATTATSAGSAAPAEPPALALAPAGPPDPELEPPGARPLDAARAAPSPADPTGWAVTVGGVAAVSDGRALGGGVDVGARAERGDLHFAPSVRVLGDVQTGAGDEASGRALEVGLAAGAGYQLLRGPVPLGLSAAARAAWRWVDPTELVGKLACQPSEPCNLGDVFPEDSSPFHAFTAWLELAADTRVTLDDAVALELGLGFGVNPGFVTAGRPNLSGIDPGLLVRQPPRLPRWRAGLSAGLSWEVR